MKRFRFTLDPVLQLRHERERVALERWIEARRSLEDAGRRVEAHRARTAGWAAEFRALQARGAVAAELLAFQRFGGWLQGEERRLAQELAQAKAAADQAHHALELARRDREAMEKYRDRRRAIHDRELLREEQKTLDELAGRRRSEPTGSAALECEGAL
ncbi:MAG: flagellar export protein FliJ [Limisphaerales bacterium]